MYIDPEQIKEKIREHMYGPVGSVVFHIILIILLIKFLVFAPTENIADLELELVELETVELEELKEEIEELTEDEDFNEDVEAPEPVAEEAPPDPTAVDSPMAELDFDALAIDADFSSPLVLRGLYAGRTSAGRAAMLGRYGGGHGGNTEKAVKRALRWLADHQNSNGSWGTSGGKTVGGLTGLGLLTFLAHGETPASKEYGETVEKAIKYLVSIQSSDGTIGQKGYAHGITTYAICEAYALTKIPTLKGVMQNAVKCLIDGQSEFGTWNYGYNNTERQDFSVSGWQMQALKAAKLAGYEDMYEGSRTIDEAVELSITCCKAFQAPNGQFGYSKKVESGQFPAAPGSGKQSMTGVGVLCLQLLGMGRDAATHGGLRALANAQCKWDQKWHEGWHGFFTYDWYYISQAKFHAGKGTWKAWNAQFAPEFVKAQHPTGYWDSSHNFKIPDAQLTGKYLNERIYNTELAALTLMVYYRHLPSYNKIEDAVVDEQIRDVDVGNEIDVDII